MVEGEEEPGPDVGRHIFGEGIEAREGPADDGEDAALPSEHRARDAVCDEGHTGRPEIDRNGRLLTTFRRGLTRSTRTGSN